MIADEMGAASAIGIYSDHIAFISSTPMGKPSTFRWRSILWSPLFFRCVFIQ